VLGVLSLRPSPGRNISASENALFSQSVKLMIIQYNMCACYIKLKKTGFFVKKKIDFVVITI
jgi:hypothetical protein